MREAKLLDIREPLVRMENIHKSFGMVRALKGVDFEVGENKVVALLGDNGAGKSTLVKILAGVLRPDKGTIYVQGKRVEFASPADARAMGIETVHQELSLVEQMSIARNFFLGKEPVCRTRPLALLDLEKMNRDSWQALRDIGINVHSVEEPVSNLSGGQRQAVAIGRAIYFGAKVLILDEPLRNLSVREQRWVINYIKEVKNKGTSVIFITHNVYHACMVADRIVLLDSGVKIGEFAAGERTPEEIAECIATGTMMGLPQNGEGDFPVTPD